MHDTNCTFVSVAHRNDNRFRSDTGLQTPYPINNPTFIGSGRIAENSDSDTISDVQGGNMDNKQIRSWYCRRSTLLFLLIPHRIIIHLCTLPTRREGTVSRPPPPLEVRRSYRILGRLMFPCDYRYDFRFIGTSDTVIEGRLYYCDTTG